MAEEITLNYRTADGNVRTVSASIGDSVMDVAIHNDIDEIGAECGGSLICATCHVYLDSEAAALFPEPEDMELDMLEGVIAERREHSRLSCQLMLGAEHDGITIELPDEQ
ncbi:MAG: ferredoxin [Gammaproteobacteria bacterium]|nr:MAG: ferredoxin [Gammaproteobacteria bacterium]